uniref:No apical meristem-associated C-terminal domain-containing protein n=1 Tax=Lactuca sativa TaxID=4236 RepID=A0A9R1UMC4_LACSA|nr:hypothetical protein LSAT_V11C800415330 [Lactuca sativa]
MKLKSKDAPKWKELSERVSQTSSDSKRLRNPNGTSQQSKTRTHIAINDNLTDLEDEQPLRQPIGRNKAKKAVSSAWRSINMMGFSHKNILCAHANPNAWI